MLRRSILLLSFLTLMAAPAFADPPKAAPDQVVKLSPVALPIIVDGRVVNYVFATVTVLLTPQADVEALQIKEPYFRDALVRAAHRTPFVVASDYNRIDEGKLKSVMIRESVAIAGPGKVWGISISDETPQHQLPPPGESQTFTHEIVP